MAKPPAATLRADVPIRSGVLAAMIIVMAAAFAVVAPFFFLGSASGHDIGFHLASWMDVAEQWRQGVLYPRWSAWANHGFGEPRFVFYPPASWMLGAALGYILPWKAVPGAFIWLALTMAGASMFRLAREWMPTVDATRAAVFYAVNPYHLVVAYFRSDFAELLASALFPLVLLYAARMGGSVSKPKRLDRTLGRDAVPLALVFAAIWLSNAPAAVIATYSLSILLVVLAVVRRSAAPLLGGGIAWGAGFLLAGLYVVPAAFEQGWVNIAEVLSSGLRPEQNFLFATVDDPEHNLFNLVVSTVASAEVIITGVAVLASSHTAVKLPKGALGFRRALFVVFAVSVALMLPATSLAWRYLPKLRFVQFPWRWLVPIGLAFALFVAAALRQARAPYLSTLLVAAALVAGSAYLAHEAWWDTQDAPALEAAIKAGQGFEGTDEYAPRGTDPYDLPQESPLVDLVRADSAGIATGPGAPGRAKVERWGAETKVIMVEAQQPVTLVLRLLNYPAWRVEVNGKPAHAESRAHTGEMLIPVRAGLSHVRVHLARTADRTAGWLLSFSSGLLLLGLALAGRSGPSAPQA